MPQMSCPGSRHCRRVLVLIAAIVGAGGSDASGQADPFSFGTEWRWVDFGPEDGLPGGNVRELLEVGEVAWVWTDDGVASYDGFTWRPVVGLPLLASDSVTSLSKGHGDEVLLVFGGRLFRGDSGGVAEVTVPALDEVRRVVRAVAHPLGGIIVSTTAGSGSAELYHLRDGEARRIVVGGDLRDAHALWAPRSGRIWAGFEDGIRVLERAEWVHVDSTRFTTHVIETRSGGTFVAKSSPPAERGLSRLRDGVLEFVSEEGGHLLTSGDLDADGNTGLFIYDSGDIRVLSNGGFGALDSENARFEGATFARFSASRPGDLWVGNVGALHLYRRSLGRWGTVRRDFPDTRNWVNDLLIDQRGALWMGTAGGVSRHLGPTATEWFLEILGRDVSIVTTVTESADGSVWIGSGASFEGVLRWADERWEAWEPDGGFPGGRVHRITVGQDQSLWFATLGDDRNRGAGIYRRDRDGTLESWSQRHGLGELGFYDVLDLGAAVWVAGKAGLFRVRGEVVTHWTDGMERSPNDPSGAFALTYDGAGRVWFAGHPREVAGVGYVSDADTLVWLDPPGGRAAREVWGLTRDETGRVWVGSGAGVLSYFEDRWSLFGTRAGLGAAAVWPVVVSEAGILTGTMGSGVRVLDRGEETQPAPRVRIEPPLVDDRVVSIRWRPSAFWGSVSSEDIGTRYRVDDGPWSEWSTQRTLTLTGLGSGRHTVAVEAKGLFGQVESEPTTAQIAIPLPIFLRPIIAGPLATLLLALGLLSTYTRRRSQERISAERKSAEHLRALVESAPEAIGILDVKTRRFIDLNENAMKLFGLSRSELMAVQPLALAPEALDDGRPTQQLALDVLTRALQGESVQVDWVILDAAGERIPSQLRATLLPSVGDKLVRVSILDVREQREAAKKRSDLERQLHQVQKLEAVGKLTGGIAHDFNNLLTVIIGNLDLLRSSAGLTADDESLLDQALKSADRGADLTRRLLTFSRNQPLTPQALALGAVLPDLSVLLRRTLPATIEVVVTVPEELPTVSVDPTGFESAILNLAINSRDAMPDGGTLAIDAEVRHLDEFAVSSMDGMEPGTFVAVSVTDTGEGMSPEVADKAFDPFFTTKDVGEGTGLGLSMVYGFVRQSGGSVRIYSESGLGTTVRLFLPIAGDGGSLPPAEVERGDTPLGRGEQILIVEDDEAVREMLLAMLRSLGYEAMSTETATAALEVIRSDVHIDLVLSDIVLPGGMNGHDLSRESAILRPELPFLFASGYAEDSVLKVAQDDPTFDLIRKPFDRAELARRIRRKLD